MDYLKLLENSYEQVLSHGDEITKFEFLSCHVFDFTTYDGEMDELFFKKAIEVCLAITKQQTFDYQSDSDNYIWYLIMCNMPFFDDKLEWGTSIRGAWWDLHGEAEFEISTCGFYEGDEQILTPIKFNRAQWESFVFAMAEFAGVEI
jgi:hypothetical protein